MTRPASAVDQSVSIIIPCYQQAGYLVQAVNSALAQTHPDLEIIIVNDGSTDDTGCVARDYRASHPGRIKVIEQDNQGQARAREAGLKAASGRFLVLLDADDLLEPQMVALCLRRMALPPHPDLVMGDAWMIDADGRRLRPILQRKKVSWPRLLRNNPIGILAAVMVRMESVKTVGGLAVDGLSGVEDWDLWARMARCGMRFLPLGESVACYRQTPASTSHQAARMLQATVELLERCRKPEPRLGSQVPGSAIRPPIRERLYQELRNGKVFKALGLELAGGGCGSTTILEQLVPGVLNVRYCSDQFLEGMHYGLLLTRRPAAIRELNASEFLGQVKAYLQRRNLGHRYPALSRELGRTLADPLRKRSLWARLMERLRR